MPSSEGSAPVSAVAVSKLGCGDFQTPDVDRLVGY